MAQKTIGVTSNTQSKALRIPPLNQFIKFPCNLLDASNNILERIGIFIPASYRGTRNEHYTLSYFQPTRHMVPCITNATCNMSPIIPMYFIMLKSMHNVQIISQTSGVSKSFHNASISESMPLTKLNNWSIPI